MTRPTVIELIERLDRWLAEDGANGYYGGPTIPPAPLNRKEMQAIRDALAHGRTQR